MYWNIKENVLLTIVVIMMGFNIFQITIITIIIDNYNNML